MRSEKGGIKYKSPTLKLQRKVLLFTDWYEPGFKAGGQIRACKNLVELLKSDFHFFIFCLNHDHGDNKVYENIQSNEWVQQDENVRIWYASDIGLRKSVVRPVIAEVCPDVIYFNSMFSPKFTIMPLQALIQMRFKKKVVLAPRGMLHKGALKRKTLKKKTFLFLFNLMNLHRKIVFHATDTQESLDIKSIFKGHPQIVVAPDVPGALPVERKVASKSQGSLKLVFISRIHPKKNLLYFLERLKEIENEGSILLDVYGAVEDQRYYNQCARAADALSSKKTVQFLGPIEHDKVLTSLEDYHAFILPSLGENHGYAIFEAMSAGKPVVISDQTPWRGLEAIKVGWDIPLDKPMLFCHAVRQLADFGQSQYDEWSEHAWQFAQNYKKQGKLKDIYIKLFS